MTYSNITQEVFVNPMCIDEVSALVFFFFCDLRKQGACKKMSGGEPGDSSHLLSGERLREWSAPRDITRYMSVRKIKVSKGLGQCERKATFFPLVFSCKSSSVSISSLV